MTTIQTPNGSIVDYSDRSVAVINAPSVIWEKLANLGGLYNAKLKEYGKGWIFSKKKVMQVSALLNSPSGTVTEGPVISRMEVRRVFDSLKDNFTDDADYDGLGIITLIKQAERKVLKMVGTPES